LWFLALPVAFLVWSVKIAKARAKSAWVAFFLLLPVTNLLAFLYLAFSSAAPSEDDLKEPELVLQTA